MTVLYRATTHRPSAEIRTPLPWTQLASPLRRPRRRRTQLVQQRRVKPWSYWNPSLQLSLWFVAYLDAIEAGVITADQIPPESGLNTEVVAALKAVESGIFPTNCTGATPLSVSGANTRSSKLTLRWRLNAARLKPTGRRMRAGELSHFGSLTPGHSCSTSVRPHRRPPEVKSSSMMRTAKVSG